MYEILKPSIGAPRYPSRSDTTVASHEPRPGDVWLFTDPAARAAYTRQARLGLLKQDIRTHVMYEGRWAPEELEFKREVRRLLCAGVLVPKGTFGHLSPHPTVYQAAREGTLEVGGRRFHVEVGYDVVFEPWLARLSHPGLVGPVRVDRLRAVADACLCCQAFPMVGRLCERSLAAMRQTLRQ